MKIYVKYAGFPSEPIPFQRLSKVQDAHGNWQDFDVIDQLSIKVGDQVQGTRQYQRGKWTKKIFTGVITFLEDDRMGPLNVQPAAPTNADLLAAIQQSEARVIEHNDNTTTAIRTDIQRVETATTAIQANGDRVENMVAVVAGKVERIQSEMDRRKEEKKIKILKQTFKAKEVEEHVRIVEEDAKVKEAAKVVEGGKIDQKVFMYVREGAQFMERYRAKPPFSLICKEDSEDQARKCIAEYCREKRKILVVENSKYAHSIRLPFDMVLLVDAPDSIRNYLQLALHAGYGKAVVMFCTEAETEAQQFSNASQKPLYGQLPSSTAPTTTAAGGGLSSARPSFAAAAAQEQAQTPVVINDGGGGASVQQPQYSVASAVQQTTVRNQGVPPREDFMAEHHRRQQLQQQEQQQVVASNGNQPPQQQQSDAPQHTVESPFLVFPGWFE